MSTTAGAALYKKRQHIVEPVFGQTKDARGARRFMQRGKPAAQSEWKRLMGTHHLLKLYRRSVATDRSPHGGRTASCASSPRRGRPRHRHWGHHGYS
ncbi:MAG: transposase [Steroidobacteraceae bacterium]